MMMVRGNEASPTLSQPEALQLECLGFESM